MYNTLYVPLNIGTWQCMLMPRRQYDTRGIDIRWAYRRRRDDIERSQSASTRSRAGSSWSSSSSWDQQCEDEAINRRLLEEDCRAFDLYFRPNWDLRSITGGQALDAVRSFLSEFLNVAHWNLPTDNAGVQRVLRRAVANGELVPIVDRDQSGTASTFRPTPAPQRWPTRSTYSSQVRAEYYGGLSGAAGGGSGGGGGAVPAAVLAASAIDGDDGGGGFDWLGVAEAVGGAALGVAAGSDDGGNGMATSLAAADGESGDTSTLLGDAQPFDYTPDALSDDVEELAASTNNPNYAAKMLGYERKVFGSMVHSMKDDLDLGPADNVLWHDNGDVEFGGQVIGNMHDYN